MIFDQPPSPAPPGMTFDEMLSLPVDAGPWRESSRYLCAYCGQSASHHPHTNDIWGCRQCGTTTTHIRDHFVRQFVVTADEEELPLETRPDSKTPFEPDPLRPAGPAPVPDADQLPEFKVTLQRMPTGQYAVDPTDRKNHGLRTKLGGVPDWIQLNDDTPRCGGCQGAMTFVAQIDSIEHFSPKGPTGVDAKNRDPGEKAVEVRRRRNDLRLLLLRLRADQKRDTSY